MRLTHLVVLTACLAATGACATDDGPEPEPTPHAIHPMSKRTITVRRGGSATLDVSIDRTRWPGPVTVAISPLPDGVTTDAASKQIPAGVPGTAFVLTASPKADLVKDHEMGLSIEDDGGHLVQQTVKVIVTD